MGKKVSQLTSLSTYNGSPQVPVSVLSSSTTLTANTISFSSIDNSINDSENNLISSGFALNMALNIEGANNSENNFYSGTITSLSESKAIISGVNLVSEIANNSITLTAWESLRTSFSNISITGSYDDLLDTPNLITWTTPENQHVVTLSIDTFTISKSNGTIQNIILTDNNQNIVMDSDWNSGNSGELYIFGVNDYTFTWPSGVVWVDDDNDFADVTTGQWVRVVFEKRTFLSTDYWLFSKAGFITLS